MSSSDDPAPSGADKREAEVREAALQLLARREHSVRELETKLTGKGWPEADVGQAVADLAEAGLQSERRFAESFACQRAGRFYGPRRIFAELAHRGIDSDLATEAVEALEIDFAATAAEFYRKKYGPPDSSLEYAERARRAQALYRRGFESDHLRGLTST